MVGTYYTTKYVFDIKDNDVYWCTADPGWITGHSYGVYGPLLNGATFLIAEVTPDYPTNGTYWDIIQDYGVTIFYTAPTAIRMFMRVGEEWPNRYNLSSLRVLGSVGEPLNPEAFEWFYHVIGKTRCPVVDTWWQTETGMHMITTMIGEPMRPGFAGNRSRRRRRRSRPQWEPGRSRHRRVSGHQGALAIDDANGLERRRALPEILYTIPGCYTAADLAVKNHDDYIMILGRSDDLIVVAGHNIGTAEVESALVSHEAVAEAAVIGKPDQLKGNIIKAFVILKNGRVPGEKLKKDLVYHVRMTLGPIAIPSEIEFVDSLPKTRSGKIMRRVLKAQELGMDPGDISTLEE